MFVRAFKTCRHYVASVNDLNEYHMLMYNRVAKDRVFFLIDGNFKII